MSSVIKNTLCYVGIPVLVAAATGGGVYYYLQQSDDSQPAQEAAAPALPPPTPAPEPVEVAPGVEEPATPATEPETTPEPAPTPKPEAIPEPEPDESTCYRKRERDLMVLPGTAFDVSGNRIGYGKGFYDRYLSKHQKHTTVAVAFEFQVMDEVPFEELDILPQTLVTEKEMIG